MDNQRQIFIEKLDRAVSCARSLFDESLRSKILRTLRNPKKALLRKIIVDYFDQQRHFVLKAKTFFGRTMYVNNYEPHLWFCGMVLSPAEIRLTRYIIKHLPEKGVFFDIGAHHGLYTLLVHDLTNGATPVYAFEPAQVHTKILRKSIKGLSGVSIINAAVSSKSGTVTFYENNRTVSTLDKSFADSEANARLTFVEVLVPSVSVDDYCLENDIKPTFLKIDVEGAEQAVVAGAMNVLRGVRPDVALEVWGENNEQHLEAAHALVEIGYTPYRITEGGDITKIAEGDSLVLAGEQFDNLLFIFDKTV